MGGGGRGKLRAGEGSGGGKAEERGGGILEGGDPKYTVIQVGEGEAPPPPPPME